MSRGREGGREGGESLMRPRRGIRRPCGGLLGLPRDRERAEDWPARDWGNPARILALNNRKGCGQTNRAS